MHGTFVQNKLYTCARSDWAFPLSPFGNSCTLIQTQHLQHSGRQRLLIKVIYLHCLPRSTWSLPIYNAKDVIRKKKDPWIWAQNVTLERLKVLQCGLKVLIHQWNHRNKSIWGKKKKKSLEWMEQEQCICSSVSAVILIWVQQLNKHSAEDGSLHKTGAAKSFFKFKSSR